ncbi:MAG: sensor histidine kinase [Methanomicrobiales archaeon]
MQIIPDKYRVILAGAVLAVIWWILESALHVVVFHEGTFVQQLFSPDPHELWMRTLTFAIIIIFSVYAQNIVNRLRRAEEKTREAYSELDQIFQTAADGMRVVDRDFNVLRVNNTLLDMGDIREDEALGMKCYKTFSGPLCHTDGCPLTRILGGEERVEGEVEKERSDGSRVPCIATATPFRAPDGEVIGIVEDFKDITDLKQAEKELKKHRDHLQDLVAERTAELTATNEQLLQEITDRKAAERALEVANKKLQILSGITRHDILNQVNALAGYTDLLGGVLPDDPEMQDYIDGITKATSAVERQITFTRDYEQLGMQPSRWQRVGDVAQRAASGIDIPVSTDTGALEIFADPMLEKVFFNLFDNAIRHGEHVTEISVTCREDEGGNVVVAVEDDGVGVPAEMKEQIFMKGFGRHTGYGLFLIQEILAITGMSIRECGEEGKGARFEITVPPGAWRRD